MSSKAEHNPLLRTPKDGAILVTDIPDTPTLQKTLKGYEQQAQSLGMTAAAALHVRQSSVASKIFLASPQAAVVALRALARDLRSKEGRDVPVHNIFMLTSAARVSLDQYNSPQGSLPEFLDEPMGGLATTASWRVMKNVGTSHPTHGRDYGKTEPAALLNALNVSLKLSDARYGQTGQAARQLHTTNMLQGAIATDTNLPPHALFNYFHKAPHLVDHMGEVTKQRLVERASGSPSIAWQLSDRLLDSIVPETFPPAARKRRQWADELGSVIG